MQNSLITLFLRGSFLLLALSLGSVAAGAQGPQPLTVDLSGNVGYNDLKGVDNNMHFNYGAAAGLNITRHLTVLGEWNYLPQGSANTVGGASGVNVNGHYTMAGPALRYNILAWKGIVPFVVIGGGYIGITANATYAGTTSTASQAGDYASYGGGASFYVWHHLGIRPEVRQDRQNYSITPPIVTGAPAPPSTQRQNDVRGMISVFYQLGRTKKK